MAAMQSHNATTETPPQASDSAALRWTGHPLVDHGIATLVAFANDKRGGVNGPAYVTLDDLELFARYAEGALKAKTVTSHASVLFTSNVPYLQPSFKPERRAESARHVLRSHQATLDPSGARCAYCGRSAIQAATPTGRAYRDAIPMLTGQGVLNFAPGGDHGQAICGQCTVSLQALLFGAPSCEGRALVVQADDPGLLVKLVGTWFSESRKRIQLTSIDEKAVTWKAPRTRLIEQLVTLRREDERADQASGLTIFHLSNSGQGPGIGIHALSARVVQFVREAQGALCRQAWGHLERRAWRDAKYKDADRDPNAEERPYWRNTFYEQLFDLPASAARFVRGRLMAAQTASLDVKQTHGHIPLWGLTVLFLREVMGVEKDRIEAIRALADSLADEIIGNNDRRLFRGVFQANRYAGVRRLLLQASSHRLNRDLPALVDFEGFLLIFEEAEELSRPDWRLAWDLVLIRLIDRLHERGWIRAHKDDIDDVTSRLDEEDEAPELLAIGE
jgi:CRISPR-associated protein Cst1